MKRLIKGIQTDFKILAAQYKVILLFALQMLLFCMAMGYMGKQVLYKEKKIEPFTIAVVDKEDSDWSHMIINTVKQMKNISELCKLQTEDEDTAKMALAKHEVEAIVTIPEDFVRSVFIGENKSLIVEKRESTMLEGVVVDELITAAAKLLSSAQAGIYSTLDYYKAYNNDQGQSYNELMEEINIIFAKDMLSRERFFKQELTRATHALSSGQYYILSGFVIMMFLSLMVEMIVLQPITEQETLIRFRLAGFKARELLLGKTITLTIFNCCLGTVTLACLFAITYMLDIEIQEVNIVQVIIGELLSFTGLSSMGIAIGLVLNKKQAYGLFIFILDLVMAFIAGGIIPNAFLPDAVDKIAYLSYNRYAMRLLQSIFGAQIQSIDYIGMLAFIIICSVISLIVLHKKGVQL